jgi:hypothetical protein
MDEKEDIEMADVEKDNIAKNEESRSNGEV